jgi:hypothetical protein
VARPDAARSSFSELLNSSHGEGSKGDAECDDRASRDRTLKKAVWHSLLSKVFTPEKGVYFRPYSGEDIYIKIECGRQPY